MIARHNDYLSDEWFQHHTTSSMAYFIQLKLQSTRTLSLLRGVTILLFEVLYILLTQLVIFFRSKTEDESPLLLRTIACYLLEAHLTRIM